MTFRSVEECVKRNAMLLSWTWSVVRKTGIKMMTLLEMKKIEKSVQIRNKLNLKDFIDLNQLKNEITNKK